MCLFFFCAAFYRPHPVRAADDFSVFYDVAIDLTAAPETRVDFHVTILNGTNKTYARDYTLTIAGNKIGDIRASDPSGPLRPEVSQSSNLTRIRTAFTHPAVGIGSRQTFSVSYTDPEIGKKNGLVWMITVPKFAEVPFLSEYQARLRVPDDFGGLIFASPNPSEISNGRGNKTYFFRDRELIKSGALLNFGAFQIYDFSLKYHLKNSNFLPARRTIALPPTLRGEQEVELLKITPKPYDLTVDSDGNYLADYKLNFNQEIVVAVEGLAKISHPPRSFKLSGSLSEIPASLKNLYLKEDLYWETTNPTIKEVAKRLTDPKLSVSENAKRLFDYTVENLHYNKERVNQDLTRFGAVKALENKNNAVCMEFSDLLNTLLRAAGIPSEVLEGYAFTEDEVKQPVIGDVLHSWLRYYDPHLGWVSVDPTWTATSGLDYFSRLDTNHFVFAIKGSSSIFPYPAGAYKINPNQTRDIKVSLANEVPPVRDQALKIGVVQNQSLFGNGVLTFSIENPNGKGFFDVEVVLNTNENPTANKRFRLGPLPPFSTVGTMIKLQNNRPLNDSLSLNLQFTDFDGNFKTFSWKGPIRKTASAGPTFFFLGVLGLLELWLFRLLATAAGTRKR